VKKREGEKMRVSQRPITYTVQKKLKAKKGKKRGGLGSQATFHVWHGGGTGTEGAG